MATIFTMTHKKFSKPDDAAYVPVQVGRAVNEALGYLGDDTGDSISEKNCYYGELTGIYWVWKNYKGKENIGVCHYRRYFVDDNMKILSSEDYDKILSEYDIITSKAVYSEKSYWDAYAEAHDVRDELHVKEVIKRMYPAYYPYFLEAMDGRKNYFGNLMVTSRKLFDEYCGWLFSIFFEMEKNMDYNKYSDEYHKRVYGFLSEQLLMVWIMAKKLRVYECRVGIAGEKAETKELKLAIGQLIKMGQITQARQMMYEVLKIRPDLELNCSDLKGEIPVIACILCIAEAEQQAHLEGILSYSSELGVLIEHIRRLGEIARKKEPEIQDFEYMNKTHVTETAMRILADGFLNSCNKDS